MDEVRSRRTHQAAGLGAVWLAVFAILISASVAAMQTVPLGPLQSSGDRIPAAATPDQSREAATSLLGGGG